MQLELSPFVESDLDDIADSIAKDNPRRAVTFLLDIRAKFRDIRQNPLLYQLRPDIGDEARLAVVSSYAILFHVVGDVVRIERVAYGGRDLAGMFSPSLTGA